MRAYLNFLWIQRRILPMILQNQMAECAHACIAMISSFWGQSLDLHALRQLHPPSTQGATLRDISNIFQSLGFYTRALQVPLRALKHVRGPALLHWDMNHFVVLKRVCRNRVVIHDPALGVRDCDFAEVSRSFTGVVLEVERIDNTPVTHLYSKLSAWGLMTLMHGAAWLGFLLLLVSLSMECLSLLMPLMMQYVTDHVIAVSDADNLAGLLSGFILLMCFLAMIELLRSQMVLHATIHLTDQLSSWTMRHLLRLPLAFFEARHQGDIQSKLYTVNEVQRKVGVDFIHALLDGFMALLHLGVMLMYSVALTSMVACTLLLYWMIRCGFYVLLKRHTAASLHLHAKVASIVLDLLRAITTLKAFAKESMAFNWWRNGSITALNADIRVAHVQAILQVVQQWLFNVEHVVVMGLGAWMVLEQRLSLGMLLAFLAYRGMLVSKAMALIQQFNDYQLMSISLQRLGDILIQEPEKISEGVDDTPLIQGGLTLRDLGFRYHPSMPYIFQAINLTVTPGERVVLVGPSGCGKSTLLKVMMGLLAPTCGQIMIDGHSIDAVGLKKYRQSVASVMQDDMLLSGSILQNITFFDEQVDRDWLHTVAQWMCIHDTIRHFPMGYETLVGDMGSTLSGGQKQRLLLARALYKKPKILFLDEATSHLDVENERLINQALASLAISQVIVAHRPQTIASADRIITL